LGKGSTNSERWQDKIKIPLFRGTKKGKAGKPSFEMRPTVQRWQGTEDENHPRENKAHPGTQAAAHQGYQYRKRFG